MVDWFVGFHVGEVAKGGGWYSRSRSPLSSIVSNDHCNSEEGQRGANYLIQIETPIVFGTRIEQSRPHSSRDAACFRLSADVNSLRWPTEYGNFCERTRRSYLDGAKQVDPLGDARGDGCTPYSYSNQRKEPRTGDSLSDQSRQSTLLPTHTS